MTLRVRIINPLKIYKKLKNKGYSLQKINKIIGTEFKNQVYKNYSININSFNKLQDFLEESIKHTIFENNILKEIHLDKNEKMAEMIGIILGDGSLSKNSLRICLNADEKEYIYYVSQLMEELFKKESSSYQQKNTKSYYLRICSMSLVKALISKGLKVGNKVKNNIGVPLWIKNNKKYIIACLRGLFDTDGSIYKHETKGYIYIHLNFRSYSINLLNDFKEMCDGMNIITNKYQDRHVVDILKRNEVKKFINLIKPMKWKYFLNKYLEAEKLLNNTTKNII